MTPRGFCVLVYDCSREPVVPSIDPGWLRTDVSGSEFEVGASTSEEEVESRKSRSKRALKRPLTATPES